MIADKKSNLTEHVDKYLSQVDLVDFYVTKNIIKIVSNDKSLEFLKSNIFLLGITNKNNKNSLMILLEAGQYEILKKLIEFDYKILNYKNIHENNLIKILLAYDYFYDPVNTWIEKLDRDYIIKIITESNSQGNNFIDNLISLLNFNADFAYTLKQNELSNPTDSTDPTDPHNDGNILLKKIIFIGKNIYMLDCEKKTFFITKLCKFIRNEKFLYDIVKFYQVSNFDIYADSNLMNCIDYLILNEYYGVLDYFLDIINYVEFVNIDDNVMFDFVQNNMIDLNIRTKIILKILEKSNIAKFKNNKNQNIFYFLVGEFGIKMDILENFNSIINIHEQDIYGTSLYDIIINLSNLKKYKSITSHGNKNNKKKYFEKFQKINKKLNFKYKLVKSDIGIFTSNIIHNMLYTITILDFANGNLSIPHYTQSPDYKKLQEKLLNMSNNEKSITGYIKLYFYNFNTWMPHLILWKNKYNYWVDPNLIECVKKQSHTSNFVYVKLSVYLIDESNTRHSNAIIIDNSNKIVERFEPYGEMIFTNSSDINFMIQSQIAEPLGYKFVFVQPYPGFQSRSDEFAKHNKSYGDPMGFCLAWSFLYIYVKMELFKLNSKINPIDFINWYIINKFASDFKIDQTQNKTNKYILFIRYFGMFLDMEKNKLIKKYGLDPGLSYQNDLDIDYHNKIVGCINKNLISLSKINLAKIK